MLVKARRASGLDCAAQFWGPSLHRQQTQQTPDQLGQVATAITTIT